MAVYFARANGNVNAAIWATTPSGSAASQTFAAGDVLLSNGFTVTINVNTDLGPTGEVRNDTTGGATQGGSFTLNAVTLTANVFAGGAVNVACLTASAGSGATATIVGNLTGGTGSTASAVTQAGAGTLSVVGNVTGGSAVNSMGINTNSNTGPVVVVGNVTAGSNAPGIYMAGTSGSLTITGNVTASASQDGVLSDQTTSNGVTITGSANGAASGAVSGVNQRNAGTLTITGSCTGGGSGGAGLRNSGTGTVTVTGRAIGGANTSGGPGVRNDSTGAVTIDEIEYGSSNGASPTQGAIRFANKTSNVALLFRQGLSQKTLVDINSTSLLPAASDVRFGTTYNAGGSTGTLRVPSAANVLQGVLVDATTGTLMLTAAEFWAYATSSATTAGSMGERLRNAATVASTGQQLADALTP